RNSEGECAHGCPPSSILSLSQSAERDQGHSPWEAGGGGGFPQDARASTAGYPIASPHERGLFSLALGNLRQTGILFTEFLIDECSDLPRDLGLVAHDISAGETQQREAKPL